MSSILKNKTTPTRLAIIMGTIIFVIGLVLTLILIDKQKIKSQDGYLIRPV